MANITFNEVDASTAKSAQYLESIEYTNDRVYNGLKAKGFL